MARLAAAIRTVAPRVSRLSNSPLAILAAALVGGALVLVFIWGLAWLALSAGVSAQLPDPSIGDGDPCCGHPDNWGEVAGGLAYTAVLAVVEALILSAGVGLLGWSSSGRQRVGHRFVAWAMAGTLGAAAVVSAISLVSSARAHKLTDCDAFVFRAADWRSTDEDVHRRAAYGVAECGLVSEKTAEQVVAMLGEPYEKVGLGLAPYDRFRWYYDFLEVDVDDKGRAIDAITGTRD